MKFEKKSEINMGKQVQKFKLLYEGILFHLFVSFFVLTQALSTKKLRNLLVFLPSVDFPESAEKTDFVKPE